MDQMTVFHNPIPKPLSDCEQKEIEKALECTGKKTTFEISLNAKKSCFFFESKVGLTFRRLVGCYIKSSLIYVLL